MDTIFEHYGATIITLIIIFIIIIGFSGVISDVGRLASSYLKFVIG